MNQINYVLLVALGIALGAVGYFAGKSSNEPSAAPIQSNQPKSSQPQAEPVIPRKPTTQTPQKRAITPEAIAKAKNVPATLSNPQGDYTLAAVVEGAGANRRLDQSLQIIGDQRQRLVALSQQLDKTPADSVQQRKSIADQINEAKTILKGNLRFMAQNYAYSLKNNYVKVMHEASLLSVTVDGKARTAKRVYTFKNAEDYEDFQQKRDVYLRLKLEQAKAAQAAKGEAPPAAVVVKGGSAIPVPDSAAEQDAKLAPTPEMDVKRKELRRLYKYDPEKTYQIRKEKTALYARPARASKAEQTILKKPNAQTPQKRVITPEAIAKAKNVPATLKNPQGNYTLVAVVEGASSNSRLYQSFQAVGAQRQRLADLTQQFDKTPASSVQQRELIASQINEIKKELKGKLGFMAQKYGYSLKNDYVKIPHVVSLLSITEVDGEAKAESVYVFKNSGEYKDFQKKRDVYLSLSLKQAKTARATKKKAKLAPTPEMVAKRRELQRLYKYDPEKTYQIRIEKTALYARAAR